jgi:hypothetical protein
MIILILFLYLPGDPALPLPCFLLPPPLSPPFQVAVLLLSFHFHSPLIPLGLTMFIQTLERVSVAQVRHPMPPVSLANNKVSA